MTVKVITDSTADLPPALAEELGITVVPANVHFGEEVYRDGVEITGDEFYRRLVTASRLPTTSQPTPGDFLSAYNEKGQTTDEIISVHVSAKLSGTLNSATQAREEYGGECRIEIIDSMQGSMGLGMLVIAAAEAANRGGSLDEVAAETRAALPNVGFIGLAGHTGVPGKGRAHRQGAGVRGVSSAHQTPADHPGRGGPPPGARPHSRQGRRQNVRAGAGDDAIEGLGGCVYYYAGRS